MINHETYIDICFVISNLSKANKKKVGAILVKNNNIISFGYNGTPSGFDNTCEINGVTKQEVLHAESNAIVKCATSNYSSKDAILYTTMSPCVECAKLIIQAGIREVFYKDIYRNTEGIELLKKAKIETHEI